MQPPDNTATAVTAIANLITLILSAWILSTARSTKANVSRNTRTTRRTARKVQEVKENTDGQLTRLVELLEAAGIDLARANQRTADARRGRTPKRNPTPRKK